MDLAELFTIQDGAAQLIGSRCEACGAVAFPPRRLCGECGARRLSKAILVGRGSIVSTTHVVTPPSGFEAPIDVALVDLDEGPRVFALLTRPAGKGDTVRAVAATVRDGHPGFAFEPTPR